MEGNKVDLANKGDVTVFVLVDGSNVICEPIYQPVKRGDDITDPSGVNLEDSEDYELYWRNPFKIQIVQTPQGPAKGLMPLVLVEDSIVDVVYGPINPFHVMLEVKPSKAEVDNYDQAITKMKAQAAGITWLWLILKLGNFQNTKKGFLIMRPSWDEYFINMLPMIASRSTCKRRQLGAIMVRDNRILSTGYNAAPSYLPHCSDVGCVREKMGIASGERHELCRAVHAEQNAILQMARYGISAQGSTLYTSAFPCSHCAKSIIQVGIERVVYLEDYPDDLAKQLFAEAQVVEIEKYIN